MRIGGWAVAYAAVVVSLTFLPGCIFGRAQQRLEIGLAQLKKAVGGEPTDEARKLVYRVDGHAGRWLHEVVLMGNRFAEKRTSSDGRRYAFGFDEQGAWLSVNGKEAVAVDDTPWDSLARTRASIYRLAFAAPSEHDDVAWMGRDRRRWELAYRPDGGNTINLSIDRRHNLPKEMDWVDSWTRLVTCDRLAWEQSPDGVVLTNVRCGAGSKGSADATISGDTRRLLSMAGLDHMPAWAQPSSRRTPRAFDKPVWTPIRDPQRIKVPVHLNGTKASWLVLDSGAFHTVISEELAKAAGVMPTGEPPLFVDPPFLERSELWVGVVDTLAVGDAVLHGERVLVARNDHMLGNESGLLGQSFFREFVIDVDSPKRSVRIWDRPAFVPAHDQKRIRLSGTRPRIEGAVRDVARGHILLDTGMPDTLLVHAPLMKVKNKRRRGSSANLSPQDGGGGRSPDYFSSVRGLKLGPFLFPSMGAIGRDRDAEKLGIGVAIPAAKPPDNTLKLDLGAIKLEVVRPKYAPPQSQATRDPRQGHRHRGHGGDALSPVVVRSAERLHLRIDRGRVRHAHQARSRHRARPRRTYGVTGDRQRPERRRGPARRRPRDRGERQKSVHHPRCARAHRGASRTLLSPAGGAQRDEAPRHDRRDASDDRTPALVVDSGTLIDAQLP